MSGAHSAAETSRRTWVSVQRDFDCGKTDEKTKLQRRARPGAHGGGMAPPIVNAVLGGMAPPIVNALLGGFGAALDERARPLARQVLGPDFARVRIYTAASAKAVGAHAYTVGAHIVFGAGRYAPGAAEGNRLLDHALAHVAQQGDSPVPASLAVAEPGTALEAQADRVAASRVAAPAGAAPATVQRKGECDGKSVGECSSRCRTENDKPGTCQWGGLTYRCRCRETAENQQPVPSRLSEILPGWLMAALSATAIVAIAACLASGVCEAEVIIGAAGAAVGTAVIAVLRSAGVTVREGGDA